MNLNRTTGRRVAIAVALTCLLAGCVTTAGPRVTVSATGDQPAVSNSGAQSAAIASHSQREITVTHVGDAALKPGSQYAIYNAADTAGAERKAVVTVIAATPNAARCRVEMQYELIKPGDWGLPLTTSLNGHQVGVHRVAPALDPAGQDPTD